MESKLKYIITDYWKSIDAIPHFIDNTNDYHIKCKYLGREMYKKLSRLFEENILTKRIIENIFSKMVDYLNRIYEIEPNISECFYIEVKNMIEYYQKKVEFIECYESAENFKKFILLINLNDAIANIL